MLGLGEFSRFKKSKKIIFDGNETIGLWNMQSWLRDKPNDSDILVYEVVSSYAGRPDRISDKLYGTPMLAWVLISFNSIHYPESGARSVMNWPKSGSVIRYPRSSIVIPEVD